jgi:glucan phosphorylase
MKSGQSRRAMPKILTRIVALFLTVTVAGNSSAWPQVNPSPTLFRPPVHSTADRIHEEALAPSSRVIEHPGAACGPTDPSVGRLTESVMPTRSPGIQLENPEWLENNTRELKGKNILEVTAEMALTPEFFDLLERQMMSESQPREIDETANRQLVMERLREAAMTGSVGGIGPLLRERIISQAALGANVTGVSMLYSHVWVQVKVPVKTIGGWTRYKLEQRKIEVGTLLRKVLQPAGEMRLQMYDGTETYVKVWKAPPGTYGKASMYFLDPVGLSDVIDGRANVVYPGKEDAEQGKEEARLVQQWVLGRGSLALSKFLGPEHNPDVIVMSETAAMMAHPTAFRDGLSEDPFFKDAVTVFNDHTPLEYAHPLWNPDTLDRVHVDRRLTQDGDLWVHRIDGHQSEKFLDMTAMIVNASRGVFGVARKHAEVMKAMPGLKRFAEKIRPVTNGVSRHFWPTRDLQEHYQAFLQKTDEELCLWKDAERQPGLEWLAEREGLDKGWATRVKDMKVLVWNRRQVEYKRLERLPEMLMNDQMRERFIQSNTVIVFGGRIHPDDPYGANQYERVQNLLEQFPELRDRLIFFENYNVLEAPRLFRMADGSMMLSDDGREAAATGFQKAQLNGDIIIAVDDGAVPESVNFYGRSDNPNGFEVPYERAVDRDNKEIRTPTAEGLCKAIEQFGQVFSDRQKRGQMIRNALGSAPKVGVERTAKDQLLLLNELITDQQKEERAEQEGRILAEQAVQKSQLNPLQSRHILDHLNRPGLDPFVWKYQHNKELFHGGAGLHQFVKDFDHLKSLGTLGIWALAFHANRESGASDLGTHIRHVFKGMESTFPALPGTLTALEESIRVDDAAGRIYHQRVLMAFLRQLENELGALAASDESTFQNSTAGERPLKNRIEDAVEIGAGAVMKFNASPAQLFPGEPVRVVAEVDLKGLTSLDMRADLLLGRRSRPSQWSEMKWAYIGQGRYLLTGEQILDEHGTYRYTVRVSPRNEHLWSNGQSLDQATHSTQSKQRIYVDDRSGAQQATVREGGRILQIHAMAYGAHRAKNGAAVPGTAAYFIGQLPKILRQPFSDLYLYCLLPTGRLVNDLAKNNRRDLVGTDFFALNENPLERSQRWFVYQPATDGREDFIGSPFAYSNPMGVNPEWGKMSDLDTGRDILNAYGKGLYVDYSANQTGLDDPWLLKDDNWKATIHVDLSSIIPAAALEKLDDRDFYNVQILREKLGDDVMGLLHQEFAKKNLTIGEGLQYCVFYRKPGDFASRIIMAHARDPIQTPWIDTVQLDLAKPEARERTFEVARFWAAKGDHLRIDMADLSIRNSYMKQWYHSEFEAMEGKEDRNDRMNRLWGYPGDFWDEFYEKVMVPHQDFRVIFEGYRNLEYLNRFARTHNISGERPRIAVYEKSPYDNFASGNSEAIRNTLSGLPDRHSVVFDQNHDDSAPVDWKRALSYAKLMFALLAFSGGELLVHYLQLRGEPKMPVKQILSDTQPLWSNGEVKEIEQFHLDMLDLHASPVVQKEFKDVVNNKNKNLIAMTRELDGQRLLIVANPKSTNPEKDFIPLPASWLPQNGDRLVFEEKYYREDQPASTAAKNRTAPVYIRSLEDLSQGGHQGLSVELMPQQVHIFVVYKEPNGELHNATSQLPAANTALQTSGLKPLIEKSLILAMLWLLPTGIVGGALWHGFEHLRNAIEPYISQIQPPMKRTLLAAA